MSIQQKNMDDMDFIEFHYDVSDDGYYYGACEDGFAFEALPSKTFGTGNMCAVIDNQGKGTCAPPPRS